MEHRAPRSPEHKRLASLKPDEIGDFAGWRIRVYRSGLSLRMIEEAEEQRRFFEAKPQTLVASDYVEKDRYHAIADKYERITGESVRLHATATFGTDSYFLLEPLSADELKAISETSPKTTSEPTVILYPDELREILER